MKKLLSILIVICFIFIGCAEQKEEPKSSRGRSTKRGRSIKRNTALEDRVSELEALIEKLSHKQVKIVGAIDFHSACIHNNISFIGSLHPGTQSNWLHDNPKDEWVKSPWED